MEFEFRADPWARGILLEGLDEIQQTLRGIERVEAFERRRRAESPWL
jgi:3-isopropylmalate dehydratase small subunit